MDIWSNVFGLVNNVYVPGIFSLIIVIVGLYCWSIFLNDPASEVQAVLLKTRERLKSVADPISEDAFASIEAYMEGQPLLLPSWQRYKGSVQIEPIRSFEPASKFFTFAEIVPNRINLGLVDAIPNLLLGLGLLFTFFGLIAALYFASQGVAAASTEAAKASLGELLHAATFKFVTSLVGLVCSMAFTVRERVQLNTLSKSITRVTDQLDSRIPVWGEVQLQIESLAESRSQTTQLKRFNTDLAASIAGELQSRLEPALQKTTDNVTAAIFTLGTQLGESLGDMNQEAIKQMLESFSETLHGQTEAQANALNASLEKQIDHVAAVNSVISDTPEMLRHQLEAILANMSESSNSITEKLDGAAAVALQSFEDGSGRVREVFSSAVDGMGASLTVALQSFEDGSSRMREVFSSAVDGMGASLRSLDELVKRTKTELSDGIQQFETCVSSLREFSSTLRVTLSDLQTASGPIAESAKTMNECMENLVQLQETARNTLGQAMELSRTANVELRLTAEAIREVSSGVASSVRQAFESYSDRFNRVDELFGKTTESLEKMLDTYQTRVNGFAGELDSHLASGMGKLGSGVASLHEAIGELSETLEDTLGKLNVSSNGAGRPPASGTAP
jgi:DNA anti-recombination protein RmuC